MRPWVGVGILHFVFIFTGAGNVVHAQSPEKRLEVGGHISVLRLSEFDTTDTGAGVNVLWRVTPLVGIDGAITWFNGSDTETAAARIAKQSRTLGLIGARSGIRRGPVELFARARAGYLRFAPVDQAVCVAVTTVPLPLECLIATGYTAFATDLGGGISLEPAERVQIRVEAGDLLVRYGIKAYRANGNPTEGFTSHNLKVSSAVAWRF